MKSAKNLYACKIAMTRFNFVLLRCVSSYDVLYDVLYIKIHGSKLLKKK